MKTLLAVLTAGLLVAGAGGAVPASAATTLGPGVTQEVVFSDPARDTTWQDRRVHTRMIQLIDAAPAGEAIRGTIWGINIKAFTDALLRANARGVQVNLVLGGQVPITSGEGLRLKKALGARATHCDAHTSSGAHIHACISSRSASTMHSKYWLFSRTRTTPGATSLTSHVVATTSTNPTSSQYYQYNDLVITGGDATMYDGYVGHFQDMAAQRRSRSYADTAKGRVTSPAGLSETVFSPKAASDGTTREEASTDLVAQRLALLSGGTGCSVRASHRFYMSNRDPVTAQLVRIRRAGCTVQVLYTSMSTSTRDTLTAAGVAVRRVNAYHPSTGTETKVHHKYAVIKGTYAGIPSSALVLTGSHNWTGAALRTNDELVLALRHTPVVDAYAADFTKIWARWS